MKKKYTKLYPNYLKKAVTFSFDDGTYQDVEMINLLDYFHMKGTFNLNSKLMGNNSSFTMNSWLRNCRINALNINYVYQNHEIAGHTATHTDFKNQTEQLLDEEITSDIKALKKLTKRKIVGYAYPYGIYNEQIIAKLKENHILYARSIESTFNFNLPTNWYTYGGTCTISDSKFKNLIKRWLKLQPKTLKIFYIWGHSYELDMFHEHEKIYHLYEMLANKNDTWYATNGEIVTYLLAFKKLRFKEKERTFHNNSNFDLYINYQNKNYLIPKKSTLKV